MLLFLPFGIPCARWELRINLAFHYRGHFEKTLGEEPRDFDIEPSCKRSVHCKSIDHCVNSKDSWGKIHIPNYFEKNAYACIHGVCAANRLSGRYLWIYLTYRHQLWKCYNIKDAFDLIERTKSHNQLEDEYLRECHKPTPNRRLISASDN
jgi:hypothetical protein